MGTSLAGAHAMRATRGARVRAGIMAPFVGVLLTASSSLLDVKDPDTIDPKDANSVDGAIGAYNGAIGDFAFANDGDNGGTRGQSLVRGGIWGGEFDSQTLPTRIADESRAPNKDNGTRANRVFHTPQARWPPPGA